MPQAAKYLMDLDFRVKIAIILCLFFLLMFFMSATYRAGYWGELLDWLFSFGVEQPPIKK